MYSSGNLIASADDVVVAKRFTVRGDAQLGFQPGSSFPFTAADAYFLRVGDGVISINGSAAGGIFEFPQVASGGSVSTNSARLYSKEVSSTAEMFVKDEAGTETQISPHATDAPDWLSDKTEFGPDRIVPEFQEYTGRVRFINESRRARLMELTVNAVVGSAADKAKLEALTPHQRKVIHEESFEEYNTRRGLSGKKALVKLKWQDVQQSHRDASIEKREQWALRKEAHLDEQKQKLPKDVKPFLEPEPPLVEIKPLPAALQP